MRKKFLRKSLNICTSCDGRGEKAFTQRKVKKGKIEKGFRKQLVRICPDCFGRGTLEC